LCFIHLLALFLKYKVNFKNFLTFLVLQFICEKNIISSILLCILVYKNTFFNSPHQSEAGILQKIK